MQIENVTYLDWENCVKISNGVIELVVPRAFGIRIIHFGLCGKPNELVVMPPGKSVDADTWHIYGGHRLWIAPEGSQSMYPDNCPVEIEEIQDGLLIRQSEEKVSGLQKQVEIQVHPNKPQVTITHRMLHNGSERMELALWGITSFAPGGVGILPLAKPPAGHNGLTAHGSLALWPYSDLGRDGFIIDQQYVYLNSPAQLKQKLGVPCTEGWGAYLHNSHLFVKSFEYDPTASYPDQGSSAELYCDEHLLEVESLGALTQLDPRDTLEHVETWTLLDGIPAFDNLVDFQSLVYPRIEEWLGELEE